MKLPTRVEIKCGEAFIRFTAEVEYHVPPVAGEPISFLFQDWTEPVLAFTQYRYHHVGEKAVSVVCCTVTVPTPDDLVSVFDKFKDATEITDPDTGGAAPPPYYKPYRICQKIWGSKEFRPGRSPTILAELLRAMWMSASEDARDGQLLAEWVHTVLLDIRQTRPRHLRDQPIELIAVFKRLGDDLCATLSRADPDKTIVIARSIFSSLQSVTMGDLPESLKNEEIPEQPAPPPPAEEKTCDVRRG